MGYKMDHWCDHCGTLKESEELQMVTVLKAKNEDASLYGSLCATCLEDFEAWSHVFLNVRKDRPDYSTRVLDHETKGACVLTPGGTGKGVRFTGGGQSSVALPNNYRPITELSDSPEFP